MSNEKPNFQEYTNPISVKDSRAIALKIDNLNSMANAYETSTLASGNTNKDLLNQSFGPTTSETITPVEGNTNELEGPALEKTLYKANPIQPTTSVQENMEQTSDNSNIISDIPNVNNSYNIEATPVNLNFQSSESQNSISPFDPIQSVETKVENGGADLSNQFETTTPVIEEQTENKDEPVVSPIGNTIQEVDVTNQNGEQKIENDPVDLSNQLGTTTPVIEEQTEKKDEPVVSPIENTFKVSDAPNVFNEVSDTDLINNISDSQETKNDMSIYDDETRQSIIELNNRKSELFKALAEIYAKESELLSKNSKESSLENTASNLFYPDGVLDDSKILGNKNQV